MYLKLVLATSADERKEGMSDGDVNGTSGKGGTAGAWRRYWTGRAMQIV